jgi:glycosyltransferase involved in cell wall biosynthesis
VLGLDPTDERVRRSTREAFRLYARYWYDSGGAPETVADGESGFVVRSHADLVEALDRLVTDRPGAAAMGARGRAPWRAPTPGTTSSPGS